MGVYKVSEQGDLDIAKRYEYGIETFGLLQAQGYLLGLHDHFQTLSDNLRLGRDASEFADSLFRFTYRAHIIFYILTDNGILIVRILGQSMDYSLHL